MSEILITRDGLEALSAQLEVLLAQREQLVRRLREALDQGGAAPENGDYLDARHEQEQLERRLAQVSERLENARLVEPEVDGAVGIGEHVRVRDLGSDTIVEYRIVGTGEADPALGHISHRSPVGSALVGRRTGDVVDVEVPAGRLRLEVVALVEQGER